jgi:hypothetical protein
MMYSCLVNESTTNEDHRRRSIHPARAGYWPTALINLWASKPAFDGESMQTPIPLVVALLIRKSEDPFSSARLG